MTLDQTHANDAATARQATTAELTATTATLMGL